MGERAQGAGRRVWRGRLTCRAKTAPPPSPLNLLLSSVPVAAFCLARATIASRMGASSPWSLAFSRRVVSSPLRAVLANWNASVPAGGCSAATTTGLPRLYEASQAAIVHSLLAAGGAEVAAAAASAPAKARAALTEEPAAVAITPTVCESETHERCSA